MPNELFSRRVEAAGFCCPFAYLQIMHRHFTVDIARELGIDTRTARRWRALYMAGELKCQNFNRCVHKCHLPPSAPPPLCLELDLETSED